MARPPTLQGADDAMQPEAVAELLERQRGDLTRLSLESASCREELAALHTCLVAAGLLSPSALPASLHRRRFARTLAAHPLSCCEARLDGCLAVESVGAAVARLAGGLAVLAASRASKAVRAATRGLNRAIMEILSSRVYVCGGTRDGVEVLNSVECLNLPSLSWEALPNMLERRSDASAHVIGGKVYVCGGCNGESAQNSAMNSVLNTVERFDPVVGCWEAMPPMLFARKCAAAGVIQGKLYICGGYDATEQAIDLSECADLHTSAAWEALPLMLEPRAEPSSGVVGRRLYVCGGRGGIWVQLNSAEVLDPEDRGWHRLPPMLEPRSGATAATLGHRLYVCGGMGNSVLASVESFDTHGGYWEAVTPGCVPRYGAAAASADGRIYVFGGSYCWQHLASVECFDPETGTWTSLACMGERRLAPAVAASS